MIWFWFVAVIGAAWACGAAWLLRHGIRMKRSGTRRYSMDGEGWIIWGCLCALFALIVAGVLVGTVIDRHISKQVCAKKDSYSTSAYQWVDYHFFSYECMLITPTGNITETPVLPIENVGEPFG